MRKNDLLLLHPRWSEWPQHAGDHLGKLELGCLHLTGERARVPPQHMDHCLCRDQGGLDVSASPGVLVKQTDPFSTLTNKRYLQGWDLRV